VAPSSIRSTTCSPAAPWHSARCRPSGQRTATSAPWSASGRSPRFPDPLHKGALMKTLIGLLALLATPALAVELTVDPVHSSAGFAIKHMMVSTVHGQFSKVTGTVNHDPKDPTKSSTVIQIDPATIDTHNEKRDAHLKSADFFDVQKCPEISFKSTKVEKAGDKH